MREFIINENDSGQRLDRFISKLMPRLPKALLYKSMRKNCVKLNGKHIKDGSLFLYAGDRLQLYFKDEFFESEKRLTYIKPQLDIVYEDENILIINKAVGVVVHADDAGSENTLVNMVKSYLFEKGEFVPKNENSFSPALCNRLDRNTGGLVIAAKNSAALRGINELIRLRKIRKYYMAVVEGNPPPAGHLEGYTTRSNKITSAANTKSDGAKTVSLDYRAISSREGHSLVEIELHTGRTHQIRAQMAAEGYPLAGDTKYGGHGNAFRQALWSVRIEFDGIDSSSPLAYLNGKVIEVDAPFKKDF